MPLSKLRQQMENEKLDGLLITQKDNRRYLSGFTGSAGVLLITAKQQYLLTDSRYYEQVARQSPDWTLVKPGYQLAKGVADLLKELNLESETIGFEADDVTVSQMQSWKEELPASLNLKSTTGLVMRLRMVKSKSELEAIKAAMAVADEAMQYIYKNIKIGMTELDVAWALEVYMRTHGASALSFDTIVAVGPNSALPHATPGNTVIGKGDVVLIDMGCVVDGYCSDMTRTFSMGAPKDPQYLSVWNLVNDAVEAAKAGIKAGVSSRTADAFARDVIAAEGFGDKFGHSLGHGVGIAVHELPFVSYAREMLLPKDSVITIEPGIYLPGAFGVRLEDMAIVTPAGVEILTLTPKISVLDGDF